MLVHGYKESLPADLLRVETATAIDRTRTARYSPRPSEQTSSPIGQSLGASNIYPRYLLPSFSCIRVLDERGCRTKTKQTIRQPPTLAPSSPRLEIAIHVLRRTATHRTLHPDTPAPRRRSHNTNAGRLSSPHRLELLRRHNLLLQLETTFHLPLHIHPTQSETVRFRHRHHQRLL